MKITTRDDNNLTDSKLNQHLSNLHVVDVYVLLEMKIVINQCMSTVKY